MTPSGCEEVDSLSESILSTEKGEQAIAVAGAVMGAAVIGGIIGYFVYKNQSKAKNKSKTKKKTMTKIDVGAGEIQKEVAGQIVIKDRKEQVLVLHCDIPLQCPMASRDYVALQERIRDGAVIQSFTCSIASRQVADLLPNLSEDTARAQLARSMYGAVCDPETWQLVYKHIHNLQVLIEMEESIAVEE